MMLEHQVEICLQACDRFGRIDNAAGAVRGVHLTAKLPYHFDVARACETITFISQAIGALYCHSFSDFNKLLPSPVFICRWRNTMFFEKRLIDPDCGTSDHARETILPALVHK